MAHIRLLQKNLSCEGEVRCCVDRDSKPKLITITTGGSDEIP